MGGPLRGARGMGLLEGGLLGSETDLFGARHGNETDLFGAWRGGLLGNEADLYGARRGVLLGNETDLYGGGARGNGAWVTERCHRNGLMTMTPP